MSVPRKVVPAVAATCVLGYFLILAGEGVQAYFSPDDLMNLYGYWQRPAGELIQANVLFFSDFFRPMGGLFYLGVYSLAGFHPLPFRIACYFLLLINLYISYRLCGRLAGSREVALLATLIAAYHARFADLYYSTGTVYDLLCFSFFYGAFLFYVRIRQSGRVLRSWELVALCALYVCALNSKEMAVTLPIFLAAYEGLYHAWTGAQMRVLTVLAAITLLFVIGKTTGPQRITTNPEYLPAISLQRYFESFQTYAGKLFFLETWFDWTKGALLLLFLLLIAWIRKSPHLKLSFLIIALGILPVAFITPRGGFVLYMPMFGWSLFAATMLVWGRESIGVSQTVLFLILMLSLGWIHWSYHEPTWLTSPNDKLRITAEGIRHLEPILPRGAKVLFLNDLFEMDENWQLRGLVQLTYADHDLVVESFKRMNPQPDAPQMATFDYIFQFAGNRLVQVKPKL